MASTLLYCLIALRAHKQEVTTGPWGVEGKRQTSGGDPTEDANPDA